MAAEPSITPAARFDTGRQAVVRSRPTKEVATLPEDTCVAELACLAQALSSSTRLRLLRLVQAEELCVCELAAMLGVSQPAISQHLAKLREAGLVTERRLGQMALYRSTDVQARMAAALQRLAERPLFEETVAAHAETLTKARARRRELEKGSVPGL